MPTTVKAFVPVPVPQVNVRVLVPAPDTSGGTKPQELVPPDGAAGLQLSTTGLLKPPKAVTVHVLVKTPVPKTFGVHPIVKSGVGVGVGEGVGVGDGVGVGVGTVPVTLMVDVWNAPRLSTTMIWKSSLTTTPPHE